MASVEKNDSTDSEDDYMSDAVLQGCQDVCPGLVFNRTVKRKLEIDAKHEISNAKSKLKPRHVLEKEQREDALSKPIAENNKGFALLAKMGFKPGTTLGAKPQESALKAPIEIQIRSGRVGLGRDTEEREQLNAKMAALAKLRAERDPARFLGKFREKTRDKLEEKRIWGEVYKSQRACRQLDMANGVTKPEIKWYWPKEEKKPSLVEEEAASDQTRRLESDATSTTSDVTAEGSDVTLNTGSAVAETGSAESDEEDDDGDVNPRERLLALTEYLRTRHYYCIWCGVKYNDEDDLKECPGASREAHDDDD